MLAVSELVLRWASLWLDFVARMAWPLVAAFALFIFRRAIAETVLRLADRVKEATPGKVVFGDPQSVQKEARPEPAELTTSEASSKESLAPQHIAYLNELVGKFRKDLDQHVGDKPQAREAVAIRAAANFYGALQHERAYAAMWGQQYALLKALAAQPEGGGMPRSSAEAFYAAGLAGFPKLYEGYTFERWIEFLLNFELVRWEGETLRITVAGRSFIEHVQNPGLLRPLIG